MKQLKNGLRYTFNTVAPSILGRNYTNVLLEGSISHRLANKMYNIDYTQASLLPYLNDTVSKKHTDYNYYIFRTETGNELVLAYEWLVEDSIKEINDTYLDIRIQGASTQDIQFIKNIIGLAGYSNISILN